jgi:hypothetical protein
MDFVKNQLDAFQDPQHLRKIDELMEREGNLITMNHYFSENLEKARAERLKPAEVEAIHSGYDINSVVVNAINAENFVRVAGITNLKHTGGQ